VIAGEEEEIIEEVKKAEPKGVFHFLNLDEVDAYKEQAFANKQEELFEEKKKKTGKPYKGKRKRRWRKRIHCCRSDYRICGKDGFRSGEKVAFVTLEDYSVLILSDWEIVII
jgi:DNA polymerase-3 subunit alpha